MTAVGHTAHVVGHPFRPDDQVSDPGRDQLLAAGTAIRLDGGGPGDRPDQELTVAGRLAALPPRCARPWALGGSAGSVGASWHLETVPVCHS